MASQIYYKAVSEKRKILREEYGGMMTLKDLTRELGYSSPNSARAWVQEHAVEATRVGKSLRYETDLVARIIVDGRGMV